MSAGLPTAVSGSFSSAEGVDALAPASPVSETAPEILIADAIPATATTTTNNNVPATSSSRLSLPTFDDSDPRFRPVPRNAAASRRPVPQLTVPVVTRRTGGDGASVITGTSTRFDDDEEVDLEEVQSVVAPSEPESDARTLASQQAARQDSSSSSDEEGEKDTSKRKVTKKGVLHWVNKNDTLVGLSLKYGVTVESIRVTNKLWGSGIFERGYLLIPVTNYAGGSHSERSEEDEKKALVKRFQLITKCIQPEEALAYMVRFEYDLDSALEAYWSDLRWEKENPFAGIPNHPSTLPRSNADKKKKKGKENVAESKAALGRTFGKLRTALSFSS